MAASIQCLSPSCFALPSKLSTLSLNASSSRLSPLSFSANLSHTFFSKGKSLFLFGYWRSRAGFSVAVSKNPSGLRCILPLSGCLSMSSAQRPFRGVVVCEAATQKKADSAAKRARQAEKRRLYNKARKSEVRTRMKKVFFFFFFFFYALNYRFSFVASSSFGLH